MDERHLYFAALVASPWLAIDGTAALADGLLLCCDLGQLASGSAALGGALVHVQATCCASGSMVGQR